VLHPVTPIVLDVGVGGIITDVAAKPAIAVGVFDVHVFAAIWVVFVVICTFPIPLLTDVMRPSPPTVMLGFVYVPAETPLAGNVTELLKRYRSRERVAGGLPCGGSWRIEHGVP
jgi:hypothetical protein